MPVYGKGGRHYRYCGICGFEPEREQKRPWSLNVHCWKEHALVVFPGCAKCKPTEMYARSREGDVISHIQTNHGVRAKQDEWICWVLVDIRDEVPSTFKPRPQDLAILLAREDSPGDDVTSLVRAAGRWRERQGQPRPSTSGTSQSADRGRRRRSSSPRDKRRAPDLASIHKSRNLDDSPPASRTRSPKEKPATRRRTKTKLLDIGMSLSDASEEVPKSLPSPASAKRPTPPKRAREDSSSESSSESGSTSAEETHDGAPLLGFKALKSQAKASQRISPIKPPSPRQSPRKQPSPKKKSTVRIEDTPEREPSPTHEVPYTVWQREAQSAQPLIVRQEQPWERAVLPPQQVALQPELADLAGLSVPEIVHFQRLLTHLSTSRPGGARGLLHDSGLLPQPQPGTIRQGVDGTWVHLPEDVLDFRQLRQMFRGEEQQHAEETSRGTKGGPGKKSK